MAKKPQMSEQWANVGLEKSLKDLKNHLNRQFASPMHVNNFKHGQTAVFTCDVLHQTFFLGLPRPSPIGSLLCPFLDRTVLSDFANFDNF